MRSLAAAVAAVVALFPLYWAAVTSLKAGPELFHPGLLPDHPAWGNYARIFTEQPFGRNVINSLLAAGFCSALSLALAVPAAFALARRRFRGRRAMLYSFLGISMFPQIAVLSGLFEVVRALGLFNRIGALVLSYLIFTLPFAVWNLYVFIREIPRSVEEAALLDGAGTLDLIVRIFLPVMGPALATTFLLGFIAAWNEFLFALTFTLTERARTVPVAIAQMSGASEHEIPWALIMAASVTVTAPVIALVLVFQRRIVSGLTAGALKG